MWVAGSRYESKKWQVGRGDYQRQGAICTWTGDRSHACCSPCGRGWRPYGGFPRKGIEATERPLLQLPGLTTPVAILVTGEYRHTAASRSHLLLFAILLYVHLWGG